MSSRGGSGLPEPIEAVVAAMGQRLDRPGVDQPPARVSLDLPAHHPGSGRSNRGSLLRRPRVGGALGRHLRRAVLGRTRHRARRRRRGSSPLAFAAAPDLPPLRHVLLGINTHVNYDLPQALLAVIRSDDLTDPVLMQLRRRDHERIDHVLSSRVAAEDDELIAMGARASSADCSRL